MVNSARASAGHFSHRMAKHPQFAQCIPSGRRDVNICIQIVRFYFPRVLHYVSTSSLSRYCTTRVAGGLLSSCGCARYLIVAVFIARVSGPVGNAEFDQWNGFPSGQLSNPSNQGVIGRSATERSHHTFARSEIDEFIVALLVASSDGWCGGIRHRTGAQNTHACPGQD